ncbi:MAG TPA: BadF/BadG/BcrA/BcrD ATPase family protein, partial [Polyangiaceae bacterium]|nr:BadF/BadG/BcrA/BcrD ATPase family protein [Polyangiaceae bacterium]
MNDKCASGTGATIDKCFLKVNAPPEMIKTLDFDPSKLHHVAAKCGVFAETDIVNLIKSGIPSHEVLNSLADAIVMQNLSVLTRGNTLKHKVLLLGGPNTYLKFLQQCWRLRIPQTWKDRGYDYPKDIPIDELIFVPKNADLYAAYGAVMYGMHEDASVGWLKDTASLTEYITTGRKARLGESAGPPLSRTSQELTDFRELYAIPKFEHVKLEPGQVVKGVIGLDGGSTSSKAVIVDYETGNILTKAYQLSKGNPIADTKELLAKLQAYATDQGATLEVMGFGATGYAADVLEECVQSDVNIVETVAHMMSAVHFFGDVDVICDIGGQDIKVLFMKNGDIQNFRLSNSCSAGNGTLLQATADSFGVPVTEFAEVAFKAELAPKFSYGCAVFLDTDRVNFQKEGFSKEEMLAGLAQVLPKNVWQYVVQIPRMASLGRKFVLQGGTQYNLAAVKAQVDYIKERVPNAEVFVHPHTGEAGAIGAAMETRRVVKRKGKSTFIGIQAAIDLEYTTKNDDETTCHFCPNNCKLTFIDTKRPNGTTSRYIAGFSCEKGTVESKEAMLDLVAERKKIAQQYPNMVSYEANRAFSHFFKPEPMPEDGA